MELLRYTATTLGGRRARGSRIAESPDALRAALLAEGLSDIRVHQPAWWRAPLATRPSGREIATFTQRFGTLTATVGTPAVALQKLVALARSAGLRRVLARVAADVREGATVAESMRKEPKVFSAVYCNIVQAGEDSGRLPDMLARLAARLTTMEDLRGKLTTALIYPIGVLLIALVATGYMLVEVIPAFERILLRSGAQLPALTRAVLAASRLLRDNPALLAAGTALAVAAALYAARDERVQDLVAAVVVRVPLVGTTLTAASMANFCAMFALVYGSGLPVVDALRLAAETIPHRGMRRRVAAAAAEVAEGGTLAGALERTEVVPPEVTDAVATGESSGRLGDQMAQAADHFERELEQNTRRLSAAAEIALICLVSLGIGVIVVAIYQPLMTATRAMAQRG